MQISSWYIFSLSLAKLNNLVKRKCDIFDEKGRPETVILTWKISLYDTKGNPAGYTNPNIGGN